jgi:hypothetical protein
MAAAVERLIGDFKSRGWDCDPFDQTLAIVNDTPEQVETLLRAVMRDIPQGGTFFDAAISYLPMDAFSSLVADAIRILEEGPNEAAESLIAYTSLQVPTALHPHLNKLFSLCPNSGTYYENWPWRESGNAESDFLIGELKDSSADREKSLECLLETREMQNLLAARETFDSVGLPHSFDVYILQVGYTWMLRPLYVEPGWHIVFPKGYFDDGSMPSWLKRHHPSWTMRSPRGVSALFGGMAESLCAICGGGLRRLIEIDSKIISGSADNRTLTLATCLSCLGWEEERLFYRHDDLGLPHNIAYDGERKDPEFPSGALRQTEVRLEPTPPRLRWQDWALSNSRENLHRVLGYPSWIQNPEFPECPSCGETMKFIMQLDSELPTEECGEWLWGSGGIGYVFWCEPCCVSGAVWQCT